MFKTNFTCFFFYFQDFVWHSEFFVSRVWNFFPASFYLPAFFSPILHFQDFYLIFKNFVYRYFYFHDFFWHLGIFSFKVFTSRIFFRAFEIFPCRFLTSSIFFYLFSNSWIFSDIENFSRLFFLLSGLCLALRIFFKYLFFTSRIFLLRRNFDFLLGIFLSMKIFFFFNLWCIRIYFPTEFIYAIFLIVRIFGRHFSDFEFFSAILKALRFVFLLFVELPNFSNNFFIVRIFSRHFLNSRIYFPRFLEFEDFSLNFQSFSEFSHLFIECQNFFTFRKPQNLLTAIFPIKICFPTISKAWRFFFPLFLNNF